MAALSADTPTSGASVAESSIVQSTSVSISEDTASESSVSGTSDGGEPSVLNSGPAWRR